MYRLRVGQNIGDIRPEKLDSAEIGWRIQHQNFALETTAYRMKKKNYYFRDSNSENLSNGKTSHTGLEIDLSAHYQRLHGAVRASYARQLYEFTHAPNQILSGQDIDSAPRKLMQAELGYDITSELATKLQWHYISAYHMNESGSQNMMAIHWLISICHGAPKMIMKCALPFTIFLTKPMRAVRILLLGKRAIFPAKNAIGLFISSVIFALTPLWTRHARATKPTIAIRVFAQILLVVVLGIIKFRRADNFGCNGSITNFVQSSLKRLARRNRLLLLLGGICINPRAILCPHIIALCHALRRVMIFPKKRAVAPQNWFYAGQKPPAPLHYAPLSLSRLFIGRVWG